MRTAVCVISILLLSSFILLSCGGGGSDGSSLGDLEGTWYGVIEDDEGEGETFSLQLDSSGNIIDVEVAGSSIDDTGHLNEDWDENLFHVFYDFAPGNSNPFSGGIMIVGNNYQCAVLGDRGLFFAVLEKGAASLPAYAASDIVGTYSGGGYEFGYDSSEGSWNWMGEAINMTVDSNLAFSGSTQSDSFDGGFDALLHSPAYGGYSGTLTRVISSPKTLDISALVGPGQDCVAAWAKEMGKSPSSLDEFILIGLVK